MFKINSLNRMPKSDNKKSKKKKFSKKVLKRNGGNSNDNDDDDTSSIDSKGNIRDLIDYNDESEDRSESELEPDYTSETDTESDKDMVVRQRSPPRKAAIIASKKVSKILGKESKKNQIIYKKPSANISPKRKFPFSGLDKKRNYKRRSPQSKNSSESENESDDECEDEDDYEDDECDDECDCEDADESEDISETDTDDDDEDDEDEDDEAVNTDFGGILLALGGGGPRDSIMKPKKYNMKKEPENVKKFVKLLTTPIEENTIDEQIAQFKGLADNKQKELITALENRPAVSDSGVNLMLKILTLKLPPDVQAMILSKYNSLQSLEKSSNEYFKLRAWLDKVVSIPFGVCKDINVRLEDGSDKCAEFMKNAKKCLDDAVYGQEESKLQIMQFISTKIVNPEHRGLSLLLVGPAGIGKTSLIKNGIAKALGWPFQFISLGGDSDASTYTGHQLVYESSHCGKIVNSLIASKSMSTVLMFDEIDKISQTPKGEEIMNLLIHLTDPVQNADFEDKYLAGVPIDLSKVMFVFSANDINKIDKILLDRMMVIDLKGYDLKQKTAIAEQYLLPVALKDVNLTERISISKEILTYIIKEYANDEKGVRELKRSIEQITQKINMLRMFNSPDLPFHIKDFSLPFIVKTDHIKLFIKKKENSDEPPPGLYV